MDGNTLVTILLAVFGATGFWELVRTLMERKLSKKDAKTAMLLGLAHDRLYELCSTYIRRGYITHYEYDNLMCLYNPYLALGGNSTGTKLVEEVDKLPFHDEEVVNK